MTHATHATYTIATAGHPNEHVKGLRKALTLAPTRYQGARILQEGRVVARVNKQEAFTGNSSDISSSGRKSCVDVFVVCPAPTATEEERAQILRRALGLF